MIHQPANSALKRIVKNGKVGEKFTIPLNGIWKFNGIALIDECGKVGDRIRNFLKRYALKNKLNKITFSVKWVGITNYQITIKKKIIQKPKL